jgi:hypothetical protein
MMAEAANIVNIFYACKVTQVSRLSQPAAQDE